MAWGSDFIMASENNFFLRSNRVEGLVSLLCLGAPVHAQYSQLIEAIVESCGKDAAAIFTEPVLSHGAGDSAKTISWYSAQEGLVVDYASLDENSKANARALLRRAREQLAPAFGHEIYGSTIRDCFEVPSPQDILLVGGKICLVNWGFRKAAQAAPATGLGIVGNLIYDPNALPPATTITHSAQEPMAGASAGQAAGHQTVNIVGAAPAASTIHHIHTSSAFGPGHDEWRENWLKPLLASLAVLLLLLLLFGAALNWWFPKPSSSGSLANFQRDINSSLEERIAILRDALNGNVCRMPGTALPISPQRDGTRSQGPNFTNRPPGSGEQAQASSPDNLVDRLDRGTVLILTPTSTGLGIGTGFFISPRHIATNRHVIEKAEEGSIFIFGKKLPAPQVARKLAMSADSDAGNADFAVLALDRDIGEPLSIGEGAERLKQVTAAGYPAFIVETDAGFKRLLDGDMSSVPQMAVTQGVITARQQMSVGVLAHTATISPGNSGGPLVDACGNVVGVNTFIRADAEQQLYGNFSIEGAGLRAFLNQHGIPFRAATACTASGTTSGRP